MTRYRRALPQLDGKLFLTDGGLETDLIFNHGVKIREFAAHTLLADDAGIQHLKRYFSEYLAFAKQHNAGFLLDTQTWKAHARWGDALGATPAELREANEQSVRFISGLRDEFGSDDVPIVLAAVTGPQGDSYAADTKLTSDEAFAYHRTQIGWLAETEVDMLTAMTVTHSEEAIGMVRAAVEVELPIVVSFTVETDGCLSNGQSLGEAIEAVDHATDNAPAYFMINCAHPTHFESALNGDGDWRKRLRGLRCNASSKSHAELDECDTLDDGNPDELAGQYAALREQMPWLNVFGGCCGSDFRHVSAIAQRLGIGD